MHVFYLSSWSDSSDLFPRRRSKKFLRCCEQSIRQEEDIWSQVIQIQQDVVQCEGYHVPGFGIYLPTLGCSTVIRYLLCTENIHSSVLKNLMQFFKVLPGPKSRCAWSLTVRWQTKPYCWCPGDATIYRVQQITTSPGTKTSLWHVTTQYHAYELHFR